MHSLRNTAPWREGWLLHPEPGPHAAGGACRPGFRLLAVPGEFTLNHPDAGWRVIANWRREVEDSQAGCLAHGFILTSGGERLLGYVVAPTVLCGCAPDTAQIRLVDASRATAGDTQQAWIEGAGRAVALVQEEVSGSIRWALAWADTTVHDALVQARAALSHDVAAAWNALLLRRQEQQTPGEPNAQQATALIGASEWLLGAVRPPDSLFPGRWLDTQDQPPGMAIGPALLALPALARFDRTCALEIYETILRVTAEDRDLHALVSHDPDAEIAATPWPLFALTATALVSGLNDNSFAGRVAPQLVAVVERQFHQLTRGGALPAWRSAAEALLPDLHDDGVTSPDAASLLAAEVDALSALCAPFPDLHPSLRRITEWRLQAAQQLRDHFWDETSASFRGRMPDGRVIRRATIGDAMPLWCGDLPEACRAGARRQLAPDGGLWLENGLYDWARWPNDPEDPPSSAHVQLLVLRMLRSRGETELADRLVRALADRIKSSGHQGDSNPVAHAALVIELLASGTSGRKEAPRRISILDRLDRHRRGVATGAALLATGLFAAVAIPSLFRPEPTESVLEVQFGTAEMRYAEQDYRGALALFESLRSTPLRDHRNIDARIGDCWYRLSDWSRAEQTYRAALDRNPDQPKAWLNHALSLFRLGRYADAAARYRDFIQLFGALYPDLRERAETALALCDEQAARRR